MNLRLPENWGVCQSFFDFLEKMIDENLPVSPDRSLAMILVKALAGVAMDWAIIFVMAGADDSRMRIIFA
jgi:hypothetical protein